VRKTRKAGAMIPGFLLLQNKNAGKHRRLVGYAVVVTCLAYLGR